MVFDIDVFLLSLQGTNQWFELQDLHVTELLPQMITLAEAYIQVWSPAVISILFVLLCVYPSITDMGAEER